MAKSNNKKSPHIGQLIKGKGIYIGVWRPVNKNGKKLNQSFNLYAAPEDLRDISVRRLHPVFNNHIFNKPFLNNKLVSATADKIASKAVKKIRFTKGWNGYKFFDYDKHVIRRDEALYETIEKGEYNGEWFIPNADMLGKIYKNKDKAALKGSFITKQYGHGNNHGNWYLSSTESPIDRSFASITDFTNGKNLWHSKSVIKLSVRPVRAELRN